MSWRKKTKGQTMIDVSWNFIYNCSTVHCRFQQYFSYTVAVSFIGGENHWLVASHWQTLSHNFVYWVHLAMNRGQTHNFIVVIGSDCIGSCKANYHTITTMMAHQRPMECVKEDVEYSRSLLNISKFQYRPKQKKKVKNILNIL
jgi:hypothetical protein